MSAIILEIIIMCLKPKIVKATAKTTVDVKAEHWMHYPDMPKPAMDYGVMKVAVQQEPNYLEMFRP